MNNLLIIKILFKVDVKFKVKRLLIVKYWIKSDSHPIRIQVFGVLNKCIPSKLYQL